MYVYCIFSQPSNYYFLIIVNAHRKSDYIKIISSSPLVANTVKRLYYAKANNIMKIGHPLVPWEEKEKKKNSVNSVGARRVNLCRV